MQNLVWLIRIFSVLLSVDLPSRLTVFVLNGILGNTFSSPSQTLFTMPLWYGYMTPVCVCVITLSPWDSSPLCQRINIFHCAVLTVLSFFLYHLYIVSNFFLIKGYRALWVCFLLINCIKYWAALLTIWHYEQSMVRYREQLQSNVFIPLRVVKKNKTKLKPFQQTERLSCWWCFPTTKTTGIWTQ